MNALELTIKELTKNRVKTLDDLAKLKRRIAKKHRLPCPSNIALLKIYHEMVKNERIKKSEKVEILLRTRPVRSLSGIVNVSVLTKPYPCPGKCLYCPDQKGVPKSYLNNEPAVMRAILNKYDPYKQVVMRLRALKDAGHPTDKIELRIIGGTWSYYPKKYQSWFIKECFRACNSIEGGLASLRRLSLKWTQKLNEKAKHRIVGLSIETRPDFINQKEIRRLRILGVTMVELGVQSIYDDVLKLNKRGHKVKATIRATKLLKDAGFKVCYQMMPDLPGSDLKRDKRMFEELFANPDFQPDLLKIYPCALLKEAPLYQWWKKNKNLSLRSRTLNSSILSEYKPYTDNQLINLVKSIKKIIPPYVRIQRITRDIPSQSIVAGPAKISNLRQIIADQTKKENWQCQCIRCREVGRDYNPKEKLYLSRQNYQASQGKEIFLIFENKSKTKLYSLLRLRIASNGRAIIREIHTYGQVRPINQRSSDISPQHKGLGKKLIREAEKIAKKEFGLNKISVISGIGVRDYWRKLNYRLENTYMVKFI